MRLLKNKYFLITVIFFTFLLDRLFKGLVFEREGFFVIKDFLKINLYQNWGIALSIPISQYLVYPLIFLILIIIFYYFFEGFKKNDYLLLWATGLIFVGALSNLIDRFRFGYVVDYINFMGRLPVFNLGDVMIICGMALIIGGKILLSKKRRAVT